MRQGRVGACRGRAMSRPEFAASGSTIPPQLVWGACANKSPCFCLLLPSLLRAVPSLTLAAAVSQ
eukprot:9903994-Prorocentrum_lima.AAC.1